MLPVWIGIWNYDFVPLNNYGLLTGESGSLFFLLPKLLSIGSFAITFSLVTWSTLSSQVAYESMHLWRGRVNNYPY